MCRRARRCSPNTRACAPGCAALRTGRASGSRNRPESEHRTRDMRLRLRSIAYLAEDINGYELVDPNGRDLPRFEAGAHIGVRLGDDLWRDYSLYNDPAERRRYCIAVLRETLGAASRHIHDELRVGDPV